MLPFHLKGEPTGFGVGDWIYVPGIREALEGDLTQIRAWVLKEQGPVELALYQTLTQGRKRNHQGRLLDQLQSEEMK